MNKFNGKVLVAEDETKIRDYLCDELEKAGIKAIPAKDGFEAFEIFKRESDFDAILSDITMPKMNGLDFLKQIRTLGKNIPFVILSAHGTSKNVEIALQHGAFDFVEKPWNDDVLLETLLRAVELGKMIQIWENDPSMSNELASYLKENSKRTENVAKGLLAFPNRKFTKSKES